MIDRVRYAALLHIRNLQGKGDSHIVTRRLLPIGSTNFLNKVGALPSDIGKTWYDAYLAAAELFANTPFRGNEEAMKKAYKRFAKMRSDERRRAAYWVTLREFLDIPDAPTGGVT